MSTPLSYLGPYRLLKIVYSGEASRIWQAYHDGKQQFIGIKTLAEKYKHDRQWIGHLKWECKVGLTLNHERLLRVLEFNVDKGTPYLAMEWYSSPNMKQRLHQGIEKIAHLLPQIIVQASEGLAYFNEQGWIHRDVKPDNFLVSNEGQVKLIDFALARRKRGLLGKLFSQRSKVQGTRSYMSPEQIRSWALDERSDLYSLGCTLFHLVAGTPPFVGSNTNELLSKHLKARPPSLEAANPNVSPAFSNLIRRTMAKKPADRPPSVSDFLEELRHIPIFPNNPEQPNRATTTES